MLVIPVALAGRDYEIHVGRGLIERLPVLGAGYFTKPLLPIVADGQAFAYHGSRLIDALAAAGYEVSVYQVGGGEAAKSWSELERLTDWLLSQGVDRGDHVIALGGGVVGDLAGFACAILKRGCGIVHCPTTLLAQVDSSIGGKTAINTATGKNLIGAFHQPGLVIADLDTLATLPDREMRAGYAEVLKYAVLGDAEFFGWLEQHGPQVLAHDTSMLEHTVGTCAAMKARIVEADEREISGSRALLNLGHSFGHALEAETGFSDRLLHGEAVALGMVLAAQFSDHRGLIDETVVRRIAGAIEQAGLPSRIATLGLYDSAPRLVGHMRHDKKAQGNRFNLILLRAIGEAFFAPAVDPAEVEAFLTDKLRAG